MKLSDMEWIICNLDMEIRKLAERKGMDSFQTSFYDGKGKSAYQGTVNVYESKEDGSPYLGVDVMFYDQTPEAALSQYEFFEDTLLFRFRLKDAMLPNRNIKDYIIKNLLPGPHFEIELD